jgi:hypothetical protein
VTRDWRKLHNEELHNLWCSSNISRMMKTRRMRWAGHVTCIREMRNAHQILVEEPGGKHPSGKPRHRSEDNIKMNLQKIRWKGVVWIHLAQDRACQWALVN